MQLYQKKSYVVEKIKKWNYKNASHALWYTQHA